MREQDLNLELPVEASLKSELQPVVEELRQTGVWIGTSSWKYPGWLGRIYSPSRYGTRGRLSDKKFKETCLAEYAETFSTVCVDAAFYQYPTEEQIGELAGQVPSVFKFTLKVTDHVTIPVWPRHPRFQKEGGNPNPHFLCAETFCRRYLNVVEALGERLGVMIFEFSPMRMEHIGSPRAFAERLDVFFRQLPKTYRYAVEIRNRELLGPEYLRVLRQNNVAHCFNSWNRMPSVAEQLKMPEVFTANFAVSRFLLKPGRSFQQAVDLFKPYEKLKEVYEEGRAAARKLIAEARKKGIPVFSYFGNRFEGNSPETIRAVIEGTARGKTRR
jgi:uncharacterized protein YecE (DUF72 family)